MKHFHSRALALAALVALAAPAQAAGQAAGSLAAMPASALPAATPAAPAPARAALETLLATLPEAAATEGAPRQRVVARRGDTVDTVIRRSLGDFPFKEAFLRGVFMELNASALQAGSTRLQPGAELVLPTVSDLRAHLLRVLGPVPVAVHAAGPGSPAAGPSGADRRHWPRYP